MPESLQLRGNPGRRPRLSDTDTEARMLQAGARYVARQGLSLSLEHLSMEDLIKDAGVSRTSSYRRWPTKDAFAAELLLHIAENTRLKADFAPYADVLQQLDPTLLADLDTEQGRRDLIIEAFRALTDADFAASLASEEWRSYIVLRAAHASLPEGELRTRINAALRETERGFVAYRAQALAASASLMGYRLRDPDAVDWPTLAESVSASFTGMAIRAFADVASVLEPRVCAPFGSSRPATWTLPTLASAQLFFGATEPDPAVIWDADRVGLAVRQLTDAATTLGLIWSP